MPDPARRAPFGYGCAIVRGRGDVGWTAIVTRDDGEGAREYGGPASWCGADHQTQAGAILEALDHNPSSTQAQNEILTSALRSLGLDIPDTVFYESRPDTLEESLADALDALPPLAHLPHADGYRVARRHGDEGAPLYLTSGGLWTETPEDAGTWARDVAMLNLQYALARLGTAWGHLAVDLEPAPG